MKVKKEIKVIVTPKVIKHSDGTFHVILKMLYVNILTVVQWQNVLNQASSPVFLC